MKLTKIGKNSRTILIALCCILFLMLETNIFAANINATKENTESFFIKAENIKYDKFEETIIAEGKIKIINDDYLLIADSITINLKEDLAYAAGNVKLKPKNQPIITGEQVIFHTKMKNIIVKEFASKLKNKQGESALLASRYVLKKDDVMHLFNTSYTSCDINCSNKPIWQINAQEAEIDQNKTLIKYRNLYFTVFGVPVVFLPFFSHPSPNAEAQSGLLIPKTKNGGIVQPLYLRLKKNMDLTASPRFHKNYTIVDFQFRHLIKNGSYFMNGSLGNPYEVQNTNQGLRYHLQSQGDFSQKQVKYGFNINRTSDKSYLKNYQNIFDSYLTSSMYAHHIDGANYFATQGIYFQGLKKQDDINNGPVILPNIYSKNILPLNDDESLNLTINTDFIGFNEIDEKKLARASASASIDKKFITPLGVILNLGIYNRGDTHIGCYKIENQTMTEQKNFRHIPEFRSHFTFPLISEISQESSVILSPEAAFIVGKNYENQTNTISPMAIDQEEFELSQYNLFKANRFSGIDYQEYGNRYNYGLNISTLLKKTYLHAFLGQAHYHGNSVTNNSEYVGNIGFEYDNHFQLVYNTRLSPKLHSVIDEVNATIYNQVVSAGATYTKFNGLLKRHTAIGVINNNLQLENQFQQLQLLSDLKLSKQLTIGVNSRFDIKKGKFNLLERSIKMTYKLDCVSIAAKIANNYTQDLDRGILKKGKVNNQSFSFAIDLRFVSF